MTEIAAAAVSELQRVVPFERANLMLFDGWRRSRSSTHPTRTRGASKACSTEAARRPSSSSASRTRRWSMLDLPAESPFGADHPATADLRSAAVVALSSEGELARRPRPRQRGARGVFDKVDRSLLERVGTQLSLALNNARLYEDIKHMHLGNLKALSSALNAKDYYTLGHAARVSAYMVLMGRGARLAGGVHPRGRGGRLPARHRQDRHLRPRAAQARQAERRGVGADASAPGVQRRHHPVPVRRGAGAGRAPSPRALRRQGLPGRPGRRGDPADRPRHVRRGLLRRHVLPAHLPFGAQL